MHEPQLSPVNPPPLPPPPPNPAELLLPKNFGVRGAEGMTVGELAREIFEGGRVVLYPFCVSVVILTFRRNSPLYLVRAGKDGFLNVFGYTLLSLVAGWWGFPWGPIFTVSCLIPTSRGGKDVTHQVLSLVLPPSQVAAVYDSRKTPHTSLALRLFPWLLLSGFLGIIGWILWFLHILPWRN